MRNTPRIGPMVSPMCIIALYDPITEPLEEAYFIESSAGASAQTGASPAPCSRRERNIMAEPVEK